MNQWNPHIQEYMGSINSTWSILKKGSKTGWVGQRRESERVWYSNEYDPNTVYGTFKVLI